MNVGQLIRRSLRHYARTNVGVVLGAACAATVLVGALAVGDSVRESLREQALQRIGGVDLALVAGDRFVRDELAGEVAAELGDARVAPVLGLRGVASHSERAARAGIVDVYGVDARFFSLSTGGGPTLPRPGAVLLNQRLAHQLEASEQSTIVLRVETPSHLPRDMLMANVEDISTALRVEVQGVVNDQQFGRFSLRASQIPPFAVFVSLPWLQQQLQLEGRANMLLVGSEDGPSIEATRADSALRARWTLDDAELRMRTLDHAPLFELRSPRVFLDHAVVETVAAAQPGSVGLLTYFVDELRADGRTTPYSMVTAIGTLDSDVTPTDPALRALLALLPADLPDNGIVLNDWCAAELHASPGTAVELDYLELGTQLRLETRTEPFVVSAVVPIEGAAADPGLMPEFPGLAGAESCRDWAPGVPIDLQRLSDRDQEYWDEHRGTPKGFVKLDTGRRLWSNRFGSLTAVRGPIELAERLTQELPRALDPARLGLFFRDVRTPALAAGTSATDFGGLFLGLSFFLIIAAMLLTALLFVFGAEQRTREIGTLLALGFPPARVRRLFLIEAMLLATLGAGLGAALGLAYTHAVLWGLGGLWQDAVGTTTLSFHARPGTVALGAVIALAIAVIAIVIALRRMFDRPAVELLRCGRGVPAPTPTPSRGGRRSLIVAAIALVAALAIAFLAGTDSTQAAGAFFGAGGLLLVAAISASRALIGRLGDSPSRDLGSVTALATRNAGRRPGRSLAVVALLGCGTFLVIAVQANRLEPPRDASERASGTGGFALFGRSTLPILRDLDTEQGRDAYGLDADRLADVDIVALRARDGDDASCLNLSLPQNPRLLGVRPAALAERGAFSFAAVETPPDGAAPDRPWLALDADYGPDVVPAVGDQASITWTLHKKIGDTIPYRDEHGHAFRIRIVGAINNSILQGNLIISARHFQRRYPSAGGFSTLLIDAPGDTVDETASALTHAFEDLGLELTSTSERLAAFNAVQNTYLSIFQALGGLGLLLGSVGLGMVVLRNALERRGELALLSAVGYRARSVRELLFGEHGLLLGLGLLSATAAAVLAVLPGLQGDQLSVMPMLAIVAALAISGALWVGLATWLSTRGSLLGALRDE